MSEVWVSVYEYVSKNLWICNNIMSLHKHVHVHTYKNHTFQHANRMKDVDKMCLLSRIRFFCGFVTQLIQRKQSASNNLLLGTSFLK